MDKSGKHTSSQSRPVVSIDVARSEHSNRTLIISLIISLLLHGLLMSIHFTSPHRSLLQKRERNLEIVLVNARHNRAPDNAEALAQANLDGGGTVEEKIRPTTPVPPQETQREGDTLVETRPQTTEQPVEKQQVITQNRKPAPARSTPEPTETQ